MASARKTQKETDQAIRHLMDYVCNTPPWPGLFDGLMDQMIGPIASKLDRETGDVTDELLDGPLHSIAWGFLFEEMISVEWHGEGCATTEYLKRRGWREGPHGKRYLRALADSSVKLWKIMEVQPGEWIDLRLYGTRNKPQRVIERSASEQLVAGDCLVARVMSLGKQLGLSGAPLLVSQEQAARIQQQLDDVPDQIQAIYQQLLDDKEITADDIPQDLSAEIRHTREELLLSTSFEEWALAALLSHSLPSSPTLFNIDKERIVFTRHQFAIKGNKKQLRKTLDDYFDVTDDDSWVWGAGDDNTVLGQIRLSAKHLVLETNSVERGTRGIELLQTLLTDAIDNPVGVHESVGSATKNNVPGPTAIDENLQNHPEVQALLQSHLMEHYRKTLDEPIPMLDNDSPRTCAEDSTKRNKVVVWLKTLENSEQRSPDSAFDFSGMWEELGLTDYR